MAEVQLVIGAQRVLFEDGAGGFSIEPASIEVVGSKIHTVHRGAPGLARCPPTLDFGEHLIAPAFIDAHTHLALSFLRGADAGEAVSGRMVEDLFYRMETKLQPEDVRAFTRMGAYESLLSGVGLVYDHYYFGEAVAEACLDVGLAAVVAPTLQDLAGPGIGQLESQLEATLNIAGSERLHTRGVFAAVGPHAGDTVSRALWTRAATLARSLNVPLHAHIAQSPQEWSKVTAREGLPPLAFLEHSGVLAEAPRSLLAHGLYAKRAELMRVPKESTTFLYCPSSQLVFGFPAPVLRWLELELDFVVATDCGASNDSLNVQKELRFLAGSGAMSVTASAEQDRFFGAELAAEPGALAARRGAAVAEAARWLTPAAITRRALVGAGRLHPAFLAGRIEAGALANLMVLDLNHPALWPGRDLVRALVYSDVAPALHAMIVAGRVRGEPGRFHQSLLGSDAYREAREEATRRLAALLAR